MKRAAGSRGAKILCAIAALLLASWAHADERRPEDLGVIPTPQEVTWSNESVLVDKATKIVQPGTRPRARSLPPKTCSSASKSN